MRDYDFYSVKLHSLEKRLTRVPNFIILSLAIIGLITSIIFFVQKYPAHQAAAYSLVVLMFAAALLEGLLTIATIFKKR